MEFITGGVVDGSASNTVTIEEDGEQCRNADDMMAEAVVESARCIGDDAVPVLLHAALKSVDNEHWWSQNKRDRLSQHLDTKREDGLMPFPWAVVNDALWFYAMFAPVGYGGERTDHDDVKPFTAAELDARITGWKPA